MQSITYILLPYYNDNASVNFLLADIQSIIKGCHVLIIDDGSIEKPSLNIDPLLSKVTVLELNNNVGHQKAIAIGLSYISKIFNENDLLVIMDSDGEDSPFDIPRLISKFNSSNKEAVVAKRRKRSESLIFKMFYIVYKKVFSLLTGKRIDFGNFMILGYQALNKLKSFAEL